MKTRCEAAEKTLAQLRRRVASVDEALEREYDVPTVDPCDPLEELVAAILSQNTNDRNSTRAFDAMQRAFPTWEAVVSAPLAALEAALQPGGLAHTKATRIQAMLRRVRAGGSLSLDHLAAMSDAEAEQALLAFDGVGPKTARCVLLFAMGRDVFPIDTHIHRILSRLGIIPAKLGGAKIHGWMDPIVPAKRSLILHLNLIRHGRAVCHARAPRCGECVLLPLCEHGQRCKQGAPNG